MSDFIFSRKRDGSLQVEGYEGSSAVLSIPREEDGRQVTSIADNAFSWFERIKKVVIPDSVTQIGEAAFSWCESLQEVIIPDSVKVIGEWAFIGCMSLKGIRLPDGLKKINYSTFQSCSSLLTVEIPDTVRTIGPEAFSECRSLKTVTLSLLASLLNQSVCRINCPKWATMFFPAVFRSLP